MIQGISILQAFARSLAFALSLASALSLAGCAEKCGGGLEEEERVVSAPQVFVAAEAPVLREKKLSEMPEMTLEATPPADELPVVIPTAKGIRGHIFRTHNRIVLDVALRPVVLDFDPEDEYVAEVRFKDAEGAQQLWVYLLDKRGGDHRLVRSWTERDHQVEVFALAHGMGRRAVVVVVTQSALTSEVELLSLRPRGEIALLGRVGGARAVYGDASVDRARGLVRLAKEGEVRLFKINQINSGFELRALPPRP